VKVDDQFRVFGENVGQFPPVAVEGDVFFDPAGRWAILADRNGVEMRSLDDPAVLPVDFPPPVLAVEFEAQYTLLVGLTRAELFDLGSGTPAQSLLRLDAIPGHRFSSGALRARAGEGRPWIALGELAILVPQQVLPDAPRARASLVVRSFDQDGAPVDDWRFEARLWRASTPLVQWSGRGRLIASTKEDVYVSRSLYP
jgi:hypothetical protein